MSHPSSIPAAGRSAAVAPASVRPLRLKPEQLALLLRLREKDPSVTEVNWRVDNVDGMFALIEVARGAPLLSETLCGGEAR